jgi:hypothetical protein
MKKTHKFLPIYFFALLFAACDSGDDGTATGTISGIVSAARDQSPIADAEVSIGSQTATSTADGSFELLNVPAGMAVIRASAPGFDTYQGSIQVQEGQNNHNILMEKPSIYESDPFTMYLPPEIEEVRGVIFFLTASFDSRPWIRGDPNNPFEALAARELIIEIMKTYDLAFIGNDNSHYADFFPDQAMLSALEDFAVASDHPELAHAPLLPFGYSVGGGRAVNFAFHYPERTIGVYSYKGVIYNFSDEDWESIRKIPVFLHMGEFDTQTGSLIPIPEQFGSNRDEGALWAAGIEKGVAHEFQLPMAFITTWMEGLIISRIPDEVTPGTVPVLNDIQENSGWSGDLNTFEIKPYAQFQGDPASASWLPNEETAQGWRAIFQ